MAIPNPQFGNSAKYYNLTRRSRSIPRTLLRRGEAGRWIDARLLAMPAVRAFRSRFVAARDELAAFLEEALTGRSGSSGSDIGTGRSGSSGSMFVKSLLPDLPDRPVTSDLPDLPDLAVPTSFPELPALP